MHGHYSVVSPGKWLHGMLFLKTSIDEKGNVNECPRMLMMFHHHHHRVSWLLPSLSVRLGTQVGMASFQLSYDIMLCLYEQMCSL